MAFPEDVIEKAWEIAGGRCQCERTTHGHEGRCNRPLIWQNRGIKGSLGAWEPHHLESGGKETLTNCEILCILCHSKTF